MKIIKIETNIKKLFKGSRFTLNSSLEGDIFSFTMEIKSAINSKINSSLYALEQLEYLYDVESVIAESNLILVSGKHKIKANSNYKPVYNVPIENAIPINVYLNIESYEGKLHWTYYETKDLMFEIIDIIRNNDLRDDDASNYEKIETYEGSNIHLKAKMNTIKLKEHRLLFEPR